MLRPGYLALDQGMLSQNVFQGFGGTTASAHDYMFCYFYRNQ